MHRYTLEPYKGPNTRYTCPECGKRRSFTRYIDTETGLHLRHDVGRCNRQIKCGYHYTPAYFFEANPLITRLPADKLAKWWFKKWEWKAGNATPMVSFIPNSVFKQSLGSYSHNYFALFLCSFFGNTVAGQLLQRYNIGTAKKWHGATVFWQIDVNGKIRTGKIMLYSPQSCKRVKKPYNHISWAHTALNLPAYNLEQCFFGEHLLQGNTTPVAIVESEKTAVIASVFYPAFIWLATGSFSNLTESKCQVLHGRRVILYPDLKCLDAWKKRAAELNKRFWHTHFAVSELLEQRATPEDKQQGLDLADWLIKIGWEKTSEK